MNGAPLDLSEPTIPAALAAITISAAARHVAVAVNDAVVRRADWESVTLRSGDAVEVITAVAGG